MERGVLDDRQRLLFSTPLFLMVGFRIAHRWSISGIDLSSAVVTESIWLLIFGEAPHRMTLYLLGPGQRICSHET